MKRLFVLLLLLLMVLGAQLDAVTSQWRDFNKLSPQLKLRSFLPFLSDVDCKVQSKDGIFCNTKCSQHKIIDEDGCCRCICDRGYSLQEDRTSCVQSGWGEWSSWTRCITSDWGGLQQRTRTCLTGGRVTNGRCKDEGSQWKSCSEVKRGFRIRKNIRYLNDEELHDILQAFAKFKNDPTEHGYLHISGWHGWPFVCPWNKAYKNENKTHCSWHHHPLFLSWHRLFAVQFELGLNRYLKNKTLGLPYWDWMEDGWTNLPDLVRLPTIFDPVLGKIIKNPFFRTFIPSHPKYKNKTLYNYRHVDGRGIHNYKLLLRSMLLTMNMPNYATFDDWLERVHDQIHTCICPPYRQALVEECYYSMANVPFAAFDPVFLLHHSQLDRLFVLYRELHELAGDQDWTEESFVGSYKESNGALHPEVLGAFHWPLSPFSNVTMNSNPVTSNNGVWTVASAFHHEQLFGYKYESLDIGGHSWQGLLTDTQLRHKDATRQNPRLGFISNAAPSFGFVSTSNVHFVSKNCTIP
ncbi:unnamed protein product [Clavelina lepadiformis]|uniref:Tyrosinase copper-binding domain-containing protein n=1 Tax=Clavelina lepadiformis TaxID=159417 RepID=A0ABP0G7M0_CLALP